MNIAEHIETLERALLNEEVRTNREQFAPLLDSQFFEFGSSGRIITVDEQDTSLGIVDMTLSDFALHPINDTAVLATYRIYNAVTGISSLRSSIWRFDGKHWRMFFHQGTNEPS